MEYESKQKQLYEYLKKQTQNKIRQVRKIRVLNIGKENNPQKDYNTCKYICTEN